MLIVVTFIVNAGLNFLLGLCVAHVLGPAAYGRFSVAFMGATVATTLAFDWLRLSATRYYNVETRQAQPGVRAALNAGYLAGGLAVTVFAGLALALGVDFGLGPLLVAATAAAAVANGCFEFSAALLRARFHNSGYSTLVILKNALALAGMVGVGAATRDPALVMLMAAASAAVAVAALWTRTEDSRAAPAPRRAQLMIYLRYGAPIVLANILYQIVVLANRAVVAARVDFSAAGKLSLATDMTIRLILVAGAALDVLLFQLAVHKKATEGAAAAQQQVARNILAISAALTLLCLGYVADMPAFVALAVPEKFRDQFAPLSLILAPGVTLFCLGQFCLNPIAQIEGRTNRVLAAAVATAALDLLALAAAPRDLPLAGYAALHSASLAVGALIMLGLTAPWRAYWPRARDLLTIALAGAAALAVMWPLRELQPRLLALVLVAVAGAASYGAVLYLFNLGGELRPAVARLLERGFRSGGLRAPFGGAP
jgi:O-antigen/teichoic acid export membrane protein